MHKRINMTQSGAVALFVVIFSTLLLSIVTVSYIQLMLKDQQQASNADLSQSAYDSAEAGVEDAKRLLLLNQECEANSSAVSNCSAIQAALKSVDASGQTGCYVLDGLVSTTRTDADGNRETLVQENAAGNKLDQAYTCVKVAVNTDNYLGEIDEPNESVVVPLQATGPYQQIELSWFTNKDLASNTNNPTVGFPSSGVDVSLPPLGSQWAPNDPALMRAQFIQTGTSFTLGDFDNSSNSGRSDANTLFLYPSAVGVNSANFATDARQTATGAPQPIRCKASLAAGGYACSVVIKLQNPVTGNASNRNGFLHLTALYNQSHFQIRLLNGAGNVVQFAGVQPEVDSTGRANNLFRRVQARVELHSLMTYPDAALSVTGNLCKDFTVTTEPSGYSSVCQP